MYFDLLNIRKVLGRNEWGPPKKSTLGQWYFKSNVSGSVIVSSAPYPTLGNDSEDWVEWVHASISRDTMPTYEDLKLLHKAVFKDKWAYQIFAPESRHINIHEHALHLFGRFDGLPQIPDFQKISGINSI
jgi:hypothetical protein